MTELDVVGVWLSSVAWIIVALVAGIVVGFAAFLCWSLCAAGADADRRAAKLEGRDDAD